MNLTDAISELRQFADIHGNKIKIARIAKIPQDTLRRFCKSESNPRLSTILLILDAKNQIEQGGGEK